MHRARTPPSKSMSRQIVDYEAAVIEVVREALGSQTTVTPTEWYVRRENYVVCGVETTRPSLRLVVKLEIPGERPNRRFDSMAAIGRLVRARTAAPTFDVVAVDTSRRKWPWEYLIMTELAGVTWASLYPRLDAAARSVALRQIGSSAAQLHVLRFDAYGQIGAYGEVVDGTGPIAALRIRAQRRIRTPRYLDIMLDVLEARAALFEGLPAATLCHEDMNPYNLVFALHDRQPFLSGILDFESAWASTGESDLARLELWRLTAGDALREGYAEIAPIDAGYPARRPVLQLLWCLEYAEHHPSDQHRAVTDQVCAELGIPSIHFDRR